MSKESRKYCLPDSRYLSPSSVTGTRHTRADTGRHKKATYLSRVALRTAMCPLARITTADYSSRTGGGDRAATVYNSLCFIDLLPADFGQPCCLPYCFYLPGGSAIIVESPAAGGYSEGTSLEKCGWSA